MQKSSEKIDQIMKNIHEKDFSNNETIIMTIHELQTLYSRINDIVEGQPKVILINSYDIGLLVIFPEVTPQRFFISRDTEEINLDQLDYMENKQLLGEKEKSKQFFRFFLNEICLYWVFFTLTFSITGILLFISGDYEIYPILSGYIVEACAIFLGAYLVFSFVSNNSNDLPLFQSGTIQKFISDDINLTYLAILSLALAFFAAILSSIFKDSNNNFMILQNILDHKIEIGILSIIMSSSISILFHILLLIAKYYFSRFNIILFRTLSDKTFHNSINQRTKKHDKRDN